MKATYIESKEIVVVECSVGLTPSNRKNIEEYFSRGFGTEKVLVFDGKFIYKSDTKSEKEVIKKTSQASVNNEKTEFREVSDLKFWFEYWKTYIPIFILGFVAGCTLFPLVKDLLIWLVT